MNTTPTTRVVLVRPPRYVWPFNRETSAFWPPLGLLCIAAAARERRRDVRVEVIDAPGERIGWKTLAARLERERIDVLGIGEETVSAHEGLRAAGIVKRAHPDCIVVAGGPYFAHAIETTLADGRVDVVVCGEGEATFVEWLERWRDRHAWAEVCGLAFRDDAGQVVVTPPRPLIAELDALPFPAYDLVDMARYGDGARSHPALTSLEHSRGCIDACGFCILWKHMGESVNGNGRYRPHYRTKSPERSFAEVERLYRAFGRRTFGWVDPTFNASPAWADGWAERMLTSAMMDRRGRPRTLHTAWMRADGVVRDERLGVLEKLVRAGLRQVMIGVERTDRGELAALNKRNNDPEVCREAFAIFAEKYPQVYTIGTMIFGLAGDTAVDLQQLVEQQYVLDMDYCFFMPLTPNPGTAAAAEAQAQGRIVNRDLAAYNFHTPVCRTDTLSPQALEQVYWRITFTPDGRRIGHAVRRFLFTRDRRKRRVHWSLIRRGTVIAAKSLYRAVLRPRNATPLSYSRKPSWYDS
jgi:anaerobic magnesium-protoporphyrin IX monomethyl ester cyclase